MFRVLYVAFHNLAHLFSPPILEVANITLTLGTDESREGTIRINGLKYLTLKDDLSISNIRNYTGG